MPPHYLEGKLRDKELFWRKKEIDAAAQASFGAAAGVVMGQGGHLLPFITSKDFNRALLPFFLSRPGCHDLVLLSLKFCKTTQLLIYPVQTSRLFAPEERWMNT